MKRRLAVLLLFPFMAAAAQSQTPLRVACVGDSITYGDKLDARETECYPAALARLAQGRFQVGNFGVNGATAISTFFRTWTETLACRQALEFAPDVVVVMLGLNDLLGYRERLDDYPAALRDVVARFQARPSKPRLFLCTLTPIAPPEAAQDVNRLVRETMNPAIRAVAAETGAAVIDVAAVFPNRLDLLPDGLHPTPAGAEIIARAVWAALEPLTGPAPPIQPAPVAGPVDLSIRNEARAAQARAARWLRDREPPADEPPQEPDADVAARLPLLADGAEAFRPADFAALAAALARGGEATVFLPDGRPVAWREALLRQVVRRQKIDARGGGYWTAAGADDVRATADALRAIAVALDE
ncbi:MAG: GDSL-type esterase/lipase family protein [Kiritimatiellia bacterium]